MRVKLTEMHWLDEHQQMSLSELVQLSGLPESELRELADYGVISPLDPQASMWTFSANCAPIVRTAWRLRQDFDLDTQGLAVALTLIDRVNELESRLRELSAQSPHRIL